MSNQESLFSKSVSEKIVRADPENNNYTIPRTYGVYQVLKITDGKKFRFGNHPVRENELVREFENIKRIAIFLEKEDAKALADSLNK